MKRKNYGNAPGLGVWAWHGLWMLNAYKRGMPMVYTVNNPAPRIAIGVVRREHEINSLSEVYYALIDCISAGRILKFTERQE